MRATSLLALTVLTLAPAQAQDRVGEPGEAPRPRGVVELFTSQGCSSCPKADEVMADLAEAGDVVALAYHVDYWDYRGWRDTLATPQNTERQGDYVRSLNSRTVYTPQAVINGRTHVNGADAGAVQRVLGEDAGKALPVGVRLTQTEDTLIIEVDGSSGAGGRKQSAHVTLVSYDEAVPVAIERGENAGRTMVYWNAVRNIQTTGMWHGEPARFEIPMSEVRKKGSGGCAVLVQAMGEEESPGEIIGAANLRLETHKTASGQK